MHLTVVLVVVLALSEYRVFGRIYGGEPATGNDFPWMAVIRRNRVPICGGSIINRRTILTAAHCVYGIPASRLSVRVGSKRKSSGGQLISAAEAVYHAAYDNYTMDYDIGMVRLAADIFFAENVRAITLPKRGELPPEDTLADVVGWGFTENGPTEFLHFVAVRIVDQETCQMLFPDHLFSERMLCAGYLTGGRDHCYDDSGGPLVIGDTLVGIVSWAADDECALPYQPSAYTQVALFIDWISDYLEQFNESNKN